MLGFFGAVVVGAVAVVLAPVLTTNGGGGGSSGESADSGRDSTETSGSGSAVPTGETGETGAGAPIDSGDPPADPMALGQVVADALTDETPDAVNAIACDESKAAAMRGTIEIKAETLHPTARVVGNDSAGESLTWVTISYSWTRGDGQQLEDSLKLSLVKMNGTWCGTELVEQP